MRPHGARHHDTHDDRIADDHADGRLPRGDAKHDVPRDGVIGVHTAHALSVCFFGVSFVQIVCKRGDLLDHAAERVVLGQLHNVFREQLAVLGGHFRADFAGCDEARHHIGVPLFCVHIHGSSIGICVGARHTRSSCGVVFWQESVYARDRVRLFRHGARSFIYSVY